jgi:hypothetical protein
VREEKEASCGAAAAAPVLLLLAALLACSARSWKKNAERAEPRSTQSFQSVVTKR